jgi:hypothetical protein
MQLRRLELPARHSRRFLAATHAPNLDSARVADHGRHSSQTRSTTMSGRALLLGSAMALALVTMSVGTAAAASWFEMGFYLSGPRYHGILPPCDAPEALQRISSRFNHKENGFWKSDLAILGFDRIRETSFRSWAPNTIPRRFCSGVVDVSDGVRRAIHYAIGEDTGMIGASWGVEWCVVGLDRNWAYNPACKMARP